MITNTGGAATGPLQVQYSGARILVASGSCASLAPGASCTLSVVATPGPPGMFSASVTVSDSSGAGVTLATTGNGRYRLTVIVQGTGTVTTTPPGIDCGSTCSALVGIGGVTLHARNTNGSGSYLTGWTNACSGPDRNCIVTLSASLSVTATFSPLTNNLVFVTSQGIPTNKGSAVAYDADCNAAATAAGINNAAGNGYIAFVSDAASPALTRLPAGVQGWIRLDGKPFSTTTSNLFTNNQVLNPIFFNELGRASTLRYALTGSRADGTLAMSCANWTSVSDPGGASLGLVAGGPHTWGGSVLGGGCTNQLAWVAICMGKTSQAALQLPAAPPGARRIWITNTLYTVGSMTPNQKCMAERPAGVTSAAALIATTDRPASAALIAATTYVRVDGTVVGTGGEIGFGQGLRSGIWQSADGTYSAIDVGNNVGRVWTGSSGPGSMGSVETTCNNWTDPAQPSGFQGNFSTVEGEWWQAGVGVPCNDAAHSGRLYCIQTAP
jgi:hypothetical protein